MANDQKPKPPTELQVMQADLMSPKFKAAYDATLPASLRRIMPLERAANILLRAMQKNERLAKCDPRSLKQTLLDSAALGLELAGPLHHAHAVPYWSNKKGILEAQLQIGYQGYLELGRRTGEIDGAPIVQWVYERDNFKINFASHASPITHEPYLDGNRGNAKLVYCLTWFKSGGYHFDFMSYSDVEEHRDKYAPRDKEGRFSDAWVDDFLEMGRKTIIRRASKHWPLSSEFAMAREYEEDRELGKGSVIVDFGDNTQTTPPPSASRSAELAEKLGSSQPPASQAPAPAAEAHKSRAKPQQPKPSPMPQTEKKVDVKDNTKENKELESIYDEMIQKNQWSQETWNKAMAEARIAGPGDVDRVHLDQLKFVIAEWKEGRWPAPTQANAAQQPAQEVKP